MPIQKYYCPNRETVPARPRQRPAAELSLARVRSASAAALRAASVARRGGGVRSRAPGEDCDVPDFVSATRRPADQGGRGAPDSVNIYSPSNVCNNSEQARKN